MEKERRKRLIRSAKLKGMKLSRAQWLKRLKEHLK
ncbi:unnamed protein product, partial [marine sediment metagenome]